VALERDPSHSGKFVLVISASAGTGRLRLQALQHGKSIVVTSLPSHGGHPRRLGAVSAKNVDGVVVFGKASVQEQGLHLPITFLPAPGTGKTKASKPSKADTLPITALDAALAEWTQDNASGTGPGRR
jgi:hypothetical protein